MKMTIAGSLKNMSAGALKLTVAGSLKNLSAGSM